MKNLLITTFGEYNHVEEWIKGDRNFDVALINYDYHEIRSTLIGDLVWYDNFHTFKYPGIWSALADAPSLLSYDYFWMPDEDIKISTDDINRMFRQVATLNMDLTQPSVERSNDSFPSWELFVHKDGFDIVLTNFVEVGCPLFSRKALEKCLSTFPKSQSGWGLDIVWPKLIGNDGSNIGVLNSITVKHTRPIRKGELYDALQEKRISPCAEKRKLMKEYGVMTIDTKEYGYRVLDNDIR